MFIAEYCSVSHSQMNLYNCFCTTLQSIVNADTVLSQSQKHDLTVDDDIMNIVLVRVIG